MTTATRTVEKYLRNLSDKEFCLEVKTAFSFGCSAQFKIVALNEMQRRGLTASEVWA